jgi:two-component system nitrogen regulation sensor histidine kinase NtrY
MPRGEAKARVPLLRRLADMLLGRGVTLGLAVCALVMGIATFVLLSRARRSADAAGAGGRASCW